MPYLFGHTGRRATTPNHWAGRACGTSSSARGGGNEDADHDGRADCCARQPLIFQHIPIARYACRLGDHSPITRATPSTSPGAQEHAHPQALCIEDDSQSEQVVQPGTNAPHLAPSLQAPGAFAEDPDEAGGATMVEGGAPAPLVDPTAHSRLSQRR